MELVRSQKRSEAIQALEQSRDYTFKTNKNLASLANCFLARAYAEDNDIKRFERNIDVSIQLSRYLGNNPLEDKDFVLHTPSAVLEEKSNGHITLKQPQRTLLLRQTIEKQIEIERNIHLHMWIPLDWAQAQIQAGEAEESVYYAREFFHRSSFLQSPHVLSRTFKHARALQRAGYGEVRDVKDFIEELRVYAQTLDSGLMVATL